MDDILFFLLPVIAILALMMMSIVDTASETSRMEACVAADGTWKDGNCVNNH